MSIHSELLNKIETRTATVGVIGIGYVGLPLAVRAGQIGFHVIGFDVSSARTESINAGESYIDDIASDTLGQLREQGRMEATTDFRRLRSCDVVVVCVPTPLNDTRDPDISFIEQAAEDIARVLRS